jgi:hypothetical protein
VTSVRKNTKSGIRGAEPGRDRRLIRADPSRGAGSGAGSGDAVPDDEVVRGVIERLSGRHPFPWRNQPSDGENHVTDANGDRVYDGADAAEMFRLYGRQADAEAGNRGPKQR